MEKWGKYEKCEKCNKKTEKAILTKVKNIYNSLFIPYLSKKIPRKISKYDKYIITYNINIDISYIYFTRYNDRNQCFLISKNGVYCTIHRFKDDIFKGNTLLQGHYYNNMFVVNDIINYDNKIQVTPIYQRISLCNNILDYKYIYDPVLSSHKIILMDFVESKFIYSLWSNHRFLKYSPIINGLIFHLINNFDRDQCIVIDNIKYCDFNTISYKNRQNCEDIKHNIYNGKNKEFEMVITDLPDVFRLYNGYKYYGLACVPNKKISLYLRKITCDKKNINILCQYSTQYQGWIPNK
jgi:hypothetical protein